jgi:uncharacterized membrane protein
MESIRISRARLEWLARESSRWRDAGAIDEQTRARILSGYEGEPLVRGPVLLIVLAILMFGIGVLLLIGYNWHRIPDSVKVAMILAAVAASFAGSAAAYARQRAAAGEGLGLLGTLLYGNGIWLIAQVLHIQGYFPDAFLWFLIGAGACAFLLRSKWIGVETAILLVAWVVAASAASQRPVYLFAAAWPAVLAIAYRLRSPVTLGIAAFAMPVWAFFSTVTLSREPVFLGAAAATGCALYAIGAWHRDKSPMKHAWQIAGLFPLLITFVPLLVSEVHREATREGSGPTVLPLVIVIAASACVATLARRRLRDPATAAVVIVAAAVFTWTVLLAFGIGGQASFALGATIAFSVLALLLSVALIRTALSTNRPHEFGFGVLFAAVFLIVRWTSVIDNMFLSGLIMLAAGAGLLFVVRLWRQRDRALALHGRLS